MSSAQNVMDWASLLEMLIADGVKAKANYDAARAIAAQAGITDADLAAADARFAKVYTDPLGGTPVPDPPPPVYSFIYNRWLPSDPGDEALKANDYVYGDQLPNPTQFYVNEAGPLQLGGGGAPKSENLIRVVHK